MEAQHAKKSEEKVVVPLTVVDTVDAGMRSSGIVMPKYGICKICRVPLEYNSETDEVYCPICGRVYDTFVKPYMEAEYPKSDMEEETIQVHRKISLADRYSIESEIRRKHLREAKEIIRRAAGALGLSANNVVVSTAQELFARYLKIQKTRSDSLEITVYAVFLAAARNLGYTITEETLLSALKKYPPQEMKKLAKQIRSKRREITSLLKLRTSLVGEDRDQPIKLLEMYRQRFKRVPSLIKHVEAIIQKVNELWQKAKNDLLRLNKIPKSIVTALTYVAAILVLPEEERIKIRQFDIADIFQTTPITIRDILPVIMKYLTPEEQQIVKSCMRRGRRSIKRKQKQYR